MSPEFWDTLCIESGTYMYTDTGNTCKYVVIVIDLCFVLVQPFHFKTWRHWILGALLQALSHAQSSDFWQPEMVYARQWLKAIHFNPCCVPQSTWKNWTPANIRYDTIYNLWLADAGSVAERQRVFVVKFWQQAPGTRYRPCQLCLPCFFEVWILLSFDVPFLFLPLLYGPIVVT